MFRCAIGHTTEPREKMVKVVTQTRVVNYANDGVGSAIVTEVPVCAVHAEQLRNMQEAEREKALLQGVRE